MRDLNIQTYTKEQYLADLEQNGLYETWNALLNALSNTEQKNEIFSISNIGELYEIALAHVNKTEKKEAGKYYTPQDVADVMSDWLMGLKGENICDVCCGTGNLILSYLKKIGKNEARKLILDKRVFLYDIDSLALETCKRIIGIVYGKDCEGAVSCNAGDFLSKKVHLPQNAKVISNPPYFHIREDGSDWEVTPVIKRTREFYAAIMEKIIDESKSSVIITPYSFIGGQKFYDLRKKMNDKNGFIVAFDNVPGNIFIGRKHGIFNSNAANSVRAAITITENLDGKNGYACSELIRFQREEREQLLNADILKSKVGTTKQIVSEKNRVYVKCKKELEKTFTAWKQNGTPLKKLVSNDGEYLIYMPNTCRYFSVGAIRNLDRTGKHVLRFKDKETRDLVYCFINSSFCYWHWRLYDGGITFNQTLLKDLPVLTKLKTSEDKEEISRLAKEMQEKEDQFLSYKMNAGKLQENIKFPEEYRKSINRIFLRAINKEKDEIHLDAVHAKHALEKEKP